MTTTTDTTQTAKPAYIAYQVRERIGKPGVFTPIGAVWPHKDGKGFTVQLEVMPSDRRIALRLPKEKSE